MYGDFKKDFVSDFIHELGKVDQLTVLKAINGFSIEKSFQIFKSITATDAKEAGISMAEYTLGVVKPMQQQGIKVDPDLFRIIQAAKASAE